MLVKSAEEIALLRFAASVSEQACRVMMEVARPGVSEALVYAETVREIHRWGCDLRYPFFSLQSGNVDLQDPLAKEFVSWRGKAGLGGRVVPDGLKAQILDELQRWAEAELGDLAARRPVPRRYRLEGVQLAR